MNAMLDKSSTVVYNSTKKSVSKGLEGHIFNMRLVSIEQKEWKVFREKIVESALTLIREINRSQRNYNRVHIEDLSNDFQKQGNDYFFDFFGGNSSIRIVFKGMNNHIQFDHIEEKIYEDVVSLF